jgi:hypothetical protein
MQSKVVGLDVDQLKAEISKTYTACSAQAAACNSPTSPSSVPSARKANATSTSGPVELPALCWKQSTQTDSRSTASSASRPAT